MSTDNFGALGADFFIKTFDKGSVMSQSDLDALVQYIQLTTTILAIGEFTPDEQESVWMILERVDVATVPDYTVTNNTDVTMTSGGLVTINSMPWSKITNKPAFFSGDYNDLTNKPTLTTGPQGATGDTGPQGPQGERAEEDRLVNGAAEVVLDSNGTLTTPAGLSISKQLDGSAVHVGSTIQSDLDKNLRLQTLGTGSGSLAWQNFEGDVNFVTLNYNQSKNILITTGNAVGEGVTHNWLFASNGNIQLPPGGDIVDIAGNSVLGGSSSPTNEITNTDPEGPTYSVSVGTDGVVTMVTSRGNLEFGALPEPGGPTHFHIMRPAGQEGSSDLYFGDDYNYVKLPSSSYSQQGVEIGSSLNQGTVSVWRFGTDGHLTLPAGGDIKDSNGTSVLGGGSASTGDVVFSYGTLSNPEDNTVRLQSQSLTQTASYNFTPQGGDYSTAVWDGTGITFNDPTQPIYDAIWALTDVSVIEVQVSGTWYTVTYGGSNTPGMPQAPTLFVNESAVSGPLNIDNVQITINQGTTSYVEIDGTDFRVDVQDDIRMYANDIFRLSNRSSNGSINIETNDGEHTWFFKSDGKLQLPSGGDIVDSNGTSVLSGGSSGWAPGGNIVQNVDTDLRLVVQDPGENNYRLDLAIEDDAGTVKTRMEMDYDRVQIEAGNGQNQWRFESNGEFRIPGNINTFDADINIIAMNAGGAGNITIKAVSNMNDIHFSQVQLTQSGVTVTTDMDNTPGGKSFEFRDTGVLALPAGGDIVDSTGASVLGGGGTTLPADASGYLNNNGSGTLTWVPGNPSGSGMLPYNGVTVLSNTVVGDWTEYILTGTMDAFYDWNNTYTTITLTSETAYGKQITPNTKNLWINDSKINSNNYLVIEFPANPTVGDVFSVPMVNQTTIVNAGSFVIGKTYTIISSGNTDWTSIGAQYNGMGVSFVATGVGSGTGTASTVDGAQKVIFKPATGQRAQTMAQGSLGSVVFGQGGTYDFMYIDLGGQNAGNPVTWVYAGVINSIPTWYQFYF